MSTYMAMHDRFNYEIFSRMKKVADPAVATAGVEPDGVKVVFRYNPDYVYKLTTTELAFVVSHNVGHVVMHHFNRNRPQNGKESQIYDLAADMAINSLFRPREGVHDVPRRVSEDLLAPDGKILVARGMPDMMHPGILGLPQRLSLEKYVGLLRDMYEKSPEEGSDKEDKKEGDGSSSGGGKSGGNSGSSSKGSKESDGGGDDSEDGQAGEGEDGKPSTSHSGWKKDSLSEAMTKEWVATMDRMDSWGNMPGDIKGLVRAAQVTSVPWDQLLREKIGNTISRMKVSTYKRPSRRIGYPWCGKKSTTRDKKLVLIDTSGSISDKDISTFVAEVDRLSEVQDVDYMTFDEVLHMEEAIPWHPGISFAFKGRGGTNMVPGLKYAEEHNYQDCIVLTDGYFHEPKEPEGVAVLWVITKGGSKKPAHFGEVVFVDPSQDTSVDNWLTFR